MRTNTWERVRSTRKRCMLLKKTLSVNGQPSSEQSRSDAAKSNAGSEARIREEVMPGKTSGEVMLLRRRHFLCSVAAWPVLCSSSGIPSSELVSESRCFFPITRRLSLGERRTSQRSTSFFLLLRTRYLMPPTTVSHKPRSRIKSRMTVLLDCENFTSCYLNLFKHCGGLSENVTSRHSELDSESRSFFLVTHNLPLGERRTAQRSTSLFLLLRTPYLLPPTTVLISPDPGSSPG